MFLRLKSAILSHFGTFWVHFFYSKSHQNWQNRAGSGKKRLQAPWGTLWTCEPDMGAGGPHWTQYWGPKCHWEGPKMALFWVHFGFTYSESPINCSNRAGSGQKRFQAPWVTRWTCEADIWAGGPNWTPHWGHKCHWEGPKRLIFWYFWVHFGFFYSKSHHN